MAVSKCPDCKLDTWVEDWGCDNCGLTQEDLEAAYEWWERELQRIKEGNNVPH